MSLLIVPFAAALECDPIDVGIAMTGGPPQSRDAMNVYLKALESMPASVDVVFVGDSLIAQWPRAMLEAALPGLSVFNFGVPRDRTGNVLWRLERTDLSHLNPQFVVIEAGTNNLGAGERPCAVAAAIEAIVLRAREIWPAAKKIVLMSVPPRGFQFGFQPQQIGSINDQLRGFVVNLVVGRFLDVGAAMSCGMTGANIGRLQRAMIYEPPTAWPTCTNYKPDWLHFTEDEGYATLTNLLAQELAAGK